MKKSCLCGGYVISFTVKGYFWRFLAKDDNVIPQNQKKVNEPFTKQLVLVETGFLRRLQAQTLSNATPPIVPPILQNCFYFRTSDAILMSFRIFKGLKQSEWVFLIAKKNYLKPFGRGGVVKLWKEKDDLLNLWMNE